jgi:hypothetical protein
MGHPDPLRRSSPWHPAFEAADYAVVTRLHAQWHAGIVDRYASATLSRITAMHTYRCYLLNGSDHIVSVDSLQAEEDDIAMVMATSLLREQHPTSAAMEVWEQKRRLGRIENTGPDSRTLRALFQAAHS